MTKTFKKVSILGLVLIAASAVTAAIIPSKNSENKKGAGVAGQLVADTQAGEVTCKPGSANACTATNNTGSTLNSAGSSVDSITTGEVNTTNGHS